jgi:peptidoglycan LD-endopeptidase CwlK
MSANVNDLVPEFREKVLRLLEQSKAAGAEMRPYFTIRDPFQQGKLWRQSRSAEEIAAKVAELKSAGAAFLAKCIDSVGPQHGDPVTNAIPGMSWHQWGEAVDCFWVVNGTAEWSTQKLVNGLNGYQVFADQAEALGLTAGGHWKSLKDWPHVQLRSAASPLRVMSLQQIDAAMRQNFDS